MKSGALVSQSSGSDCHTLSWPSLSSSARGSSWGPSQPGPSLRPALPSWLVALSACRRVNKAVHRQNPSLLQPTEPDLACPLGRAPQHLGHALPPCRPPLIQFSPRGAPATGAPPACCVRQSHAAVVNMGRLSVTGEHPPRRTPRLGSSRIDPCTETTAPEIDRTRPVEGVEAARRARPAPRQSGFPSPPPHRQR